VAQLSQFAQVEQSIAQSGHLETLSNQIGGLSNQGAADLVGSTVTVRGSTMAFDGSQPVTAGATLAGKGQVTATIKDSNGNVVRKMDLGERPAGPLPITWDGRDDQGLLKPAGSYTVEVTAVDAAGAKVGVEQDVTGKVLRVTFDKGYAALELDNGSESSVSNLVSVGTNKK
jgi:flagellar basal-body rod modification protein FlgD